MGTINKRIKILKGLKLKKYKFIKTKNEQKYLQVTEINHKTTNWGFSLSFQDYLIFLEEEGHLGSPSKLLAIGVPSNSERATGLRLPNVLFIIIVLGGNNDLLCNEVSRVEPHTELPNHAYISTSLQCLHELLGPGPRNGTQVVHQIYNTTHNIQSQKHNIIKHIQSKSSFEIPNTCSYNVTKNYLLWSFQCRCQ